VFTKLGVTSRHQLAGALLGQRGAMTPIKPGS
jgi:hypothetical protein